MKLYDWNDARLLIACAEHGGFAGAAEALSMDQKTISRRIGQLEAAIGRPLFTRRKSGSTLTAAGRTLLERAVAMNVAADELEMAMRGLLASPKMVVTIAAPEGVLGGLLIPLLLGGDDCPLPLDRGLIATPPANLTFVTPPDVGDISVLALSAGEAPAGRAAMRVRKLGAMRMVPVAAPSLLAQRPVPARFEALADLPLVDVSAYRRYASLSPWNSLVAGKTGGGLVVAPNPAGMARAVAAGAGIGLAPDFTPACEASLAAVEIPSPAMLIDLWIAAHEDVLREPTVRQLYDDIAAAFLQSPSFRG